MCCSLPPLLCSDLESSSTCIKQIYVMRIYQVSVQQRLKGKSHWYRTLRYMNNPFYNIHVKTVQKQTR